MEDRIVDGPDCKFNGYEGEAGPYFENATAMMLFIWTQKHMICKSLLYCMLNCTLINTNPVFSNNSI